MWEKIKKKTKKKTDAVPVAENAVSLVIVERRKI